MNETREDTGYTKQERSKKRVPISQYGNAAKAEKAKEECKKLLNQLNETKRVER